MTFRWNQKCILCHTNMINAKIYLTNYFPFKPYIVMNGTKRPIINMLSLYWVGSPPFFLSSLKLDNVTWEVIILKKEMFYLTTHSTHFIYGYMASDIVKYHTGNERGNPLLPHGLLFPINSKGSFICTIPQTGLHMPLLHQSWRTGWNHDPPHEGLI